MKLPTITTLSLDDVTIQLDSLPANVQQLVHQYSEWLQEKEDLRVETVKLDLALNALNEVIKGELTKFVAAQKGDEAPAEVAVATQDIALDAVE
jgi:hypothetical protein